MADKNEKVFTDEMIAGALMRSGQRSTAAARDLGCSRQTVFKFRRRRGDVMPVGAPAGLTRTYTDDDIAAALVKSGHNVGKAAAIVGCSTQTVYVFIHKKRHEARWSFNVKRRDFLL